MRIHHVVLGAALVLLSTSLARAGHGSRVIEIRSSAIRAEQSAAANAFLAARSSLPGYRNPYMGVATYPSMWARPAPPQWNGVRGQPSVRIGSPSVPPFGLGRGVAFGAQAGLAFGLGIDDGRHRHHRKGGKPHRSGRHADCDD